MQTRRVTETFTPHKINRSQPERENEKSAEVANVFKAQTQNHQRMVKARGNPQIKRETVEGGKDKSRRQGTYIDKHDSVHPHSSLLSNIVVTSISRRRVRSHPILHAI